MPQADPAFKWTVADIPPPPSTMLLTGCRANVQMKRWGRLAPVLLEVYYYEGPTCLLDAVVELSSAHLSLAIIYDQSQVSRATGHFADALFAVFELNHDLEALDRSISLYQSLLENHLAQLSPERTYIEARLGYALLHRFIALHSGEDCQTSLKVLEGAHQGLQNEYSQAWEATVTGLLKSTSDAWAFLTVTTQNLIDMLDIIRTSRTSSLPRSIYILSLVAESRLANSIFAKSQQHQYITILLETQQSALQLCSQDAEVLRYQVLVHLCGLNFNAHYHAKDHAATMTRLNKAVECVSAARCLPVLMSRNPYYHMISLQKWGMAVMQRATYVTDLDAMEQAVDALKKAVTVGSDIAPRMLFGYIFSTLTSAVGFYFDQTGRIGVLDEHLSLARPIISAYPHVLHAPFFASNIAEAMLLRAKLSDSTAAQSLVNEAIRLCQERKTSIELATVDISEHLQLDLTLINASRMQIMAGDYPFMKPLDIFQLAQESITRVPPQKTSHRTGLILAMTDALMLQAQQESDPSYLLTGLSLLQQEIDSPEMSSAMYIVELLAARGDLLYAQAITGNPVDRTLLNSAWEQYDRAITATPRRPRERFQTCLRWAHQATKMKEPSMALKAYEHAVNILPQVVFLGEEVVQRVEALRQVSGLAASSIATALTLGNIPTAIDFLERTRGILWLQSIRLRDTQLSSLPEVVRDRFVEISGELERNLHLDWTARRHKSEELGEVVSEIRTLPTFERFQLPPLLPDVHLALKKREAYAVVIVPSASYCDVMILGMDICHLRLPTITIEWTRRQSRDLNTRCTNARAAYSSAKDSRGISKVKMSNEGHVDPIVPLLSDLWTSLVHPILKHMKIPITPDLASRKKVWWCPTGALSSLPLHAAGIYEGLSQDHAGRYIISSYTPTISALYRLLEDTPNRRRSPVSSKVLLVAQSVYSDHSPLLNVRIEMDQVKSSVPQECIEYLNSGEGASVDDALESLKAAEVVHLACHGHQDQTNPLNSGFELKNARLTLEQLMRVEIPHAQLAYLSACESAGMDESRPDEGLNLVGTMIFVGFRSVIGTMWTMNDLDGPFMAKRIYTRIFRDGYLDLEAVPHAVDEAVRELRESGVSASRWATYVHFGV